MCVCVCVRVCMCVWRKLEGWLPVDNRRELGIIGPHYVVVMAAGVVEGWLVPMGVVAPTQKQRPALLWEE